VGTAWLECPQCKLVMGHARWPISPDPVWQCACENTLFYIGTDGAYCPMCGKKQEW